MAHTLSSKSVPALFQNVLLVLHRLREEGQTHKTLETTKRHAKQREAKKLTSQSVSPLWSAPQSTAVLLPPPSCQRELRMRELQARFEQGAQAFGQGLDWGALCACSCCAPPPTKPSCGLTPQAWSQTQRKVALLQSEAHTALSAPCCPFPRFRWEIPLQRHGQRSPFRATRPVPWEGPSKPCLIGLDNQTPACTLSYIRPRTHQQPCQREPKSIQPSILFPAATSKRLLGNFQARHGSKLSPASSVSRRTASEQPSVTDQLSVCLSLS